MRERRIKRGCCRDKNGKPEEEEGEKRSGNSFNRLIISFKAVVSAGAFRCCLQRQASAEPRFVWTGLWTGLRKKEEEGGRPLPVSSQIPASVKLSDPLVVRCFRTHLCARQSTLFENSRRVRGFWSSRLWCSKSVNVHCRALKYLDTCELSQCDSSKSLWCLFHSFDHFQRAGILWTERYHETWKSSYGIS